MKEGISDTYVVRDNRGNLQAYLLGHHVEIPGQNGEQPKVMYLTWYINTHANRRGERLGQALYAKAFADFEQKLRKEGKEFWGLAEEAEADVEKWFNRFHGAKRMYMQTGRGIEDVPYLAPPEDESRDGVPEHFMVRLAGGRQELSAREVRQAFEAVHDQYTDPRFFTRQQLLAEAQDPRFGIDPKEVTEKYAKDYHANYKGIVKGVSDQMMPILEKANDQRVFLMSEEERKQRKKQGQKVIEVKVEA